MAKLSSPLAHPLFRRFFVGQVVSKAGDAVFFVALPWQVILIGGGAAEIGAVISVALAAQVATSVLGGVLVDRWSRKRVVVSSDVLQGVLVGAAAVLSFSGALTIPLLMFLAILFGAFQAIAFPATGAFLPEIVPTGELASANALFQGTTVGSMVVGSLGAGALLAAWGPWSAFLFDALTFALSVALLASVRAAPKGDAGTAHRSVLAEARAGWRYVAGVPWLWMGIALFAIFNAAEASPRNVLLPVFVGVDLGGGAVALGTVTALFLCGNLVGSFLVGLLPTIKRPGVAGYLTAAFVGLILLGVAAATEVWQVGLLYFGQGLGFGLLTVVWATSVGTFVDEAMRGRVISIDMMGSLSLMPITAALAGGAAALVGLRAIFLGGAVVCMLVGALGLASRRARTFGPVPAVGPPKAPQA